MKRTASLPITLLTLFFVSPAFAQPVPDARYGSAELLAGYESAYAGQAGLGVRAGYAWGGRFYTGAVFAFHLGSSEAGSVPGDTATSFEKQTKSFYGGVEGGYEAGLGPLILRAYLGAGVIRVLISGTVVPASPDLAFPPSYWGVGLWPGVGAAVPIDRFRIGIDARYMVSKPDASGPAVFGVLGLAF